MKRTSRPNWNQNIIEYVHSSLPWNTIKKARYPTNDTVPAVTICVRRSFLLLGYTVQVLLVTFAF